MKHKDLINKKYALLKKHISKHILLEDITLLVVSFLITRVHQIQIPNNPNNPNNKLWLFTLNFIQELNLKWFWLDVKLCKCCNDNDDDTLIIIENPYEINAIQEHCIMNNKLKTI